MTAAYYTSAMVARPRKGDVLIVVVGVFMVRMVRDNGGCGCGEEWQVCLVV